LFVTWLILVAIPLIFIMYPKFALVFQALVLIVLSYIPTVNLIVLQIGVGILALILAVFIAMSIKKGAIA